MDLEQLYYQDLKCLLRDKEECKMVCVNNPKEKCHNCIAINYHTKCYSEAKQEEAINRARQGDKSAKEEIIHSLLNFIVIYAKRLQNERVSMMDLISTGNMSLVENLENALQHPRPRAYLLKSAKGDMFMFLQKKSYLISPPLEPGREPYTMENIIDPKHQEIEEQSIRIEQLFDNTPLYEALDNLAHGKEILARLYGLFDHNQEDTCDVAGDCVHSKQYMRLVKEKLRYLKICKQFLEKYHPKYVSLHTKESSNPKPHYADIEIPEHALKRLEHARKALQERGEKLSTQKLQKEAGGVYRTYASAYLHKLRDETGKFPAISETVRMIYNKLEQDPSGDALAQSERNLEVNNEEAAYLLSARAGRSITRLHDFTGGGKRHKPRLHPHRVVGNTYTYLVESLLRVRLSDHKKDARMIKEAAKRDYASRFA